MPTLGHSFRSVAYIIMHTARKGGGEGGRGGRGRCKLARALENVIFLLFLPKTLKKIIENRDDS